MIVLHLTFDHPDSIHPNKTKAVKNLYSGQETGEHLVFSLNRTMNPRADFAPVKEEFGYSMNVAGLPYGLLLSYWMQQVAKKIRMILLSNGIKPTVIHAHKLTFEGIIARHLSRELKIPFIITVRGNSDIKVLKFKTLSRPLYRRIIESAEQVIFLSPWTIDEAGQLLGEACFREKQQILPNIIDLEKTGMGLKNREKKFITVFHMVDIRGKNIQRVIRAFEEIHSKFPEFSLDIVGSGPQEHLLKSMIKRSTYPETFTMLGRIEHEEVLRMYGRYIGFILPSFPETFGFVYIEALAAGTPVIYAQNAGIDGFFNDLGVGYRVRHRSVEEITRAIESIITNHDSITGNIKDLQNSNALEQFSREAVSIKYALILEPYNQPTIT